MPSKILQISEKPQNLHSYCCSTAFHPPFKKYFSIPELPTKFSPTKCCFPKTFFLSVGFTKFFPQSFSLNPFNVGFTKFFFILQPLLFFFFSPPEKYPQVFFIPRKRLPNSFLQVLLFFFIDEPLFILLVSSPQNECPNLVYNRIFI